VNGGVAYGGHAFSSFGSAVWNSLPEYVRDASLSLDVLGDIKYTEEKTMC